MSILARLFGKAEVPLYQLIEPRTSEVLGRWAVHFPTYAEVVGYSALGHFFLRNPGAKEYAVLHPFKKAAKSYGSFSTLAEFEQNLLMEPGFQSYVLAPGHVQEIARRAGPRRPEEIYIPQPYPFLGGSCEPETYDKGNVWVFADIVAQMQSL